MKYVRIRRLATFEAADNQSKEPEKLQEVRSQAESAKPLIQEGGANNLIPPPGLPDSEAVVEPWKQGGRGNVKPDLLTKREVKALKKSAPSRKKLKKKPEWISL